MTPASSLTASEAYFSQFERAVELMRRADGKRPVLERRQQQPERLRGGCLLYQLSGKRMEDSNG